MCNFVGCLFALGYAHRWCVAKGQMEKVLNKYGKKKVLNGLHKSICTSMKDTFCKKATVFA